MGRQIVFLIALAGFIAGCATGGGPDRSAEVTGAQATTSTVSSHPESVQAFDWKIGDVCTYEYQYGSRKSVHTHTVSDIGGDRITLTDKGDDGSSGTIVLEQGGAQLRKWISQANGQQLAFEPALLWMSLPLRPGSAWAVQTGMTGKTFEADTTSSFLVTGWENVHVPAGDFVSLKITATLSYIVVNNQGERNTGTGTWAYWVAAGANCPVKHDYSDSFGDKSSRQLLSYTKK